MQADECFGRVQSEQTESNGCYDSVLQLVIPSVLEHYEAEPSELLASLQGTLTVPCIPVVA